MLEFGQHEKGLHPHIDTDGCLMMCELNFGCILKDDSLTIAEVNRVYNYLIPTYMLDGGEDRKNRCMIQDHVEVIRAGLYILGERRPRIKYVFRVDNETDWVVDDSGHPNFFVAKMRILDGFHFVQTTYDQRVIYNSGNSTGPIVSFRGFEVVL